MSGQTLKIGTRKSAMALAQTEAIARMLRAADGALDVEIVKFETRGDQDQTSKLLRHGGKGGAFVAEIREATRLDPRFAPSLARYTKMTEAREKR